MLASCTDQARDNYSKNRGTPGEWFQHKADYRNPPPAHRIRPDGQSIADKNQPTIDTLLHTYQCKDPPQQIPARLRSAEACQIANKFNFQADKWFDFEGNQSYMPQRRGYKCYSQSGKEIALMNNPQRSQGWFDHSQKPPPAPVLSTKCPSAAGREFASNLRHSKATWFTHPGQGGAARSAPSSPPAPPRTRPEGMDFAKRSQGTASQWMAHRSVQDDAADWDGVPYRCPSPQALENWEQARGKGMAACFDSMGGNDGCDRPAPRVRGDASEYLERGRGTVGLMVEGKSTGCSTPKPCGRVRPEAEEIMQRNQGQLSKWMDQAQNREYQSPRPVPRLKTGGAQEAAERNKGKMDSFLVVTSYRQATYPKKIQTRGITTDSAQENCGKNRGSSMKELVENDRLVPEPPPKARVTASGEDQALRNHGCVDKLFTNYGHMPPDSPPAPRIRPEAADNAEKYRGRDLFKVIQQKPPSART